MKKIILFGLVIVIIFGTLAFVTSFQNKQLSEGNPFGKNVLKAETIRQLDNPLYQNIIVPEDLERKLASGEAVTVYFYSPICEQCNLATPIFKPLADELGVEIFFYSVHEFEQGWSDYDLEGTPTIIHYENGQEVMRIVGRHDVETYEMYFRQVVLGE